MLVVLALIGVGLVVATSFVLPPAQGASFFTPQLETLTEPQPTILTTFIPTNVFRALSDQVVPAVVVFCLFFGVALIQVPGKEPLLDFLDLCGDVIGRINLLLVRLAPIGLFTLTADAAGSLRVEQISRLQAYLVMFSLACIVGAAAVLPLMVSSLTDIRYRRVMRAAQEPLLTALATGKLFVVLPQIIDKCEELINESCDDGSSSLGESTANVVVPLAYPFPHVGKILAFIFVTFAGWYVGQKLPPMEATAMAASGAVSSFASPLVTIPYLLDQYHLPQDLLPLFILPGFITTRLADMVGVLHLMTLTLLVSVALQGKLRFNGPKILRAGILLATTMVTLGLGCRWYLARTTFTYDLDKRLMSLELPDPHDGMVVYHTRDEAPQRATVTESSTLHRLQRDRVLRVGYHPNHVPYCYLNDKQQLVGLDVDLMNRLATRLDVRLEFVPYAYDTVVDELNQGEIDVAIGGLIMTPERSLAIAFSKSYQTATASVVLPDHRRREFDTWDDADMPKDLHLAVVYEDIAIQARRMLPSVRIETIDSPRIFFGGDRPDIDGLIIAAEEGAAWNVLYPEHTVVIPQPVIQRPVGMAVRANDDAWLTFLDRWIDFERLDGTLDRLQTFWVEGGGTEEKPPRWCILRDVLHWLP